MLSSALSCRGAMPTLLTLALVTYTAFDLRFFASCELRTNETGNSTEAPLNSSTLVVHKDRKQTIERLLGLHDSGVPPNFEIDIPTEVVVQLFIVSFDSISESTMDYSITVFLRQRWLDSRLEYKPLEGITSLELDPKVMDKIWVPDLFFVNEKRASFHDVTVPNKLMHIFPNGTVLYSVRVSMTLSCDMNLVKFPFDSQICHLSMESYGYSTKVLIFRWHEHPVLKRDKLNLPTFDFEDTKSLECTKTYAGTVSDDEGQYTCIRAEFHLSRTYGYYLAQVYVPSIMIVILSWVSFWLDVEAVPARISLGLLTILTMTTQSANARSHLPRVSYIKAIDVWMAMCLLFVFAALIEFAYVNVNARVEKRRIMLGQINSAQGGLRIGGMGLSNNHNAPGPAKTEEEEFDHLFWLVEAERAFSFKQSMEGPEDETYWSISGRRGNLGAAEGYWEPPYVPAVFVEKPKKPKSAFSKLTHKPKRLFSKTTRSVAKARTLDKISRVAFPSVFIAFNIFYWIFYLTLEVKDTGSSLP